MQLLPKVLFCMNEMKPLFERVAQEEQYCTRSVPLSDRKVGSGVQEVAGTCVIMK